MRWLLVKHKSFRKLPESTPNINEKTAPSLQDFCVQFADHNSPLKINKKTFKKLHLKLDTFWREIDKNRYFVWPYLFLKADDFQPEVFKPLRSNLLTWKRNQFHADNRLPLPLSTVSFSSDYVDPQGAVKNFPAFVAECSNSFHESPQVYFSPYLSVGQSSLYGKSRLILEVARSYFRTVYVCLREENSTGYPVRTPGAFTHLFAGFNDLTEGEDFSKILAARFRRLVSSAFTNMIDPKGARNNIICQASDVQDKS